MTGFIIGLIAGSIGTAIVMASCVVSGKQEECRECQEQRKPVTRYLFIGPGGSGSNIDPAGGMGGQGFTFHGETIATPIDPDKPVSPDNPQILTSRTVTGTDHGAITIAKEMESGGDI